MRFKFSLILSLFFYLNFISFFKYPILIFPRDVQIIKLENILVQQKIKGYLKKLTTINRSMTVP